MRKELTRLWARIYGDVMGDPEMIEEGTANRIKMAADQLDCSATGSLRGDALKEFNAMDSDQRHQLLREIVAPDIE